jgi:D-sedoheptulose 7-phosphate isomerase
MKYFIENYLDEHKKALNQLVAETEQVEKAANMIIQAIKNGNKILICGNGGSAADSQHFAAEIIVKFSTVRKALPAIALTVDSSVMTAIGNDFGFDSLFSRQVEGLGEKGDVLVAISTSGKSANVIKAVEAARAKELKVIGMAGKNGLSVPCDHQIVIESNRTSIIQEMHIAIIHMICQLIDKAVA